MKNDYDHIKDYINADINKDLRLLISDFALLWNNYESALYDDGNGEDINPNYKPSKLKQEVYPRLLNNLSEEDEDEIERIYISFLDYYKKEHSLTPDSIYKNYHFRSPSDATIDEIKELYVPLEETTKPYNRLRIKNEFLILLLIVGRVRNNMFHGLKDIRFLNNQKELFVVANRILTLVLNVSNKLEFNRISSRHKSVHLDYLEVGDIIYNDMIYAVRHMENDKKFDIFRFYKFLNSLIEKAGNNELFQIIRLMPMSKPEYYFGSVFFLLEEMVDKSKCKEELDYLMQFVDYKIDVFMLVNYLREENA